ncbi:alpha/beta fold hydrolase [Pyxidicoccus sp. 3LFB2]
MRRPSARLNLKRIHLAGNSMGIAVTWHYALLHSERGERLVLVDAASYRATCPRCSSSG